MDFFKKDENFKNLSIENKEKGSDLMGRFLFGAEMVYQKFNNRYKKFNVLFTDLLEERIIVFAPEQDAFFVGTQEFLNILGKKNEKMCSAGGVDNLSVEDFFEIAGVEEAAHFLFCREKQGYTTAVKPVPQGISRYQQSFTNILETKALQWKAAYIKRYMPQYSDSIKQTIDQTRKLNLRETNLE